jgi:putative ABC transport system permease protein
VIKDFHSRSLHHPIEPLYLFLDPRAFEMISIKIDTANLAGALAHAREVFKRRAPGTPFSFSFFDQAFERAYAAEQRAAGAFSAFSILAVVLACLGLFGLTAFASEQRTREMGIRKILGASGSRVFLLLSQEFIVWVILANFLAWPAAYWIMENWLQKFAYRITLGPVPFLISGAMVLLIAYLTMSWQSLKAARANPVESLKCQ